MLNWILSWFMPNNVSLKATRKPSEAETEANLGVDSLNGK
jgi:hypothetical protein